MSVLFTFFSETFWKLQLYILSGEGLTTQFSVKLLFYMDRGPEPAIVWINLFPCQVNTKCLLQYTFCGELLLE